MKKALIFSYSKNVGHLAHVVGYYKLFETLGFRSLACVQKNTQAYLPDDINVYKRADDASDVGVVLFYSASLKNFLKILKYRIKKNCIVLYVFHEPMSTVMSYYRAGFPIKTVLLYFIEDLYERLCIMASKHVILSSQNAISNYEIGSYKKYNSTVSYIPLLFDDKMPFFSGCERKYFSYIGTIAADHSFNEFLSFVLYAIKEKRMVPLKFLIATSSDFIVPVELQNNDRVIIKKGRYLTDEEIDKCYAETKIIWNAYIRMTQSGVLARSFMFGTPAIILKKNLSEFTVDGQEVAVIDDNTSFEEIEKAVYTILSNFDYYSKAARKRFEDTFFYVKYKNAMKKILSNENN